MERSMSEINEEQYEELLQEIDTMQEGEREFPPANIIVAGITGAGKSTLVNAVFGEELAVTGIGKPQTDKPQTYQSDNVPIRIWDTVGFEMSEDGKRTAETLNAISEIIASKSGSKDSFDRIHAIWYCINASAHRLQSTEADFIAKLTGIGVPFIIVMTQCFGDDDDEFEKQIQSILTEKGIEGLPIIQVLAKPKRFKSGNTESCKGLEELVNLTVEKMPEYLKASFIAAQRVSKLEKHTAAVEAIIAKVRQAEGGFWEKIPLARVIAANSHITHLLLSISIIYNATILDKAAIQEICHDSTSALTKGTLKELWVKKDSLNDELCSIMCDLDVDKIEIDFEDRIKIALVIALDGFRFMNALEELWDESTEAQLQDIDYLVRELKVRMASGQSWFTNPQKPLLQLT